MKDVDRLRLILHEAADLACDILARVDRRAPAARPDNDVTHAVDDVTRQRAKSVLRKHGWLPRRTG